uniref:Ig-like domain-containing protein n=1 Tax=Oreochromis aureus TaxID=47969 RepID=A0AAZ1X5K2_OREAU
IDTMVAALARSTLWWLAAVLSAASVEPFSLQGHSDITLAGSDMTIRCRMDMSVSEHGEPYLAEERDRVKFIGEFRQGNADLLIRNARPEDSGTYTCLFTLFPAGNQKVEIQARVWRKPRVTASVIPAAVADCGCSGKSPLAVCIAEGGDPEPRVKWVHVNGTSRKANVTLEGTVEDIVESVLLGIPRVKWNGEKVSCVVESPDDGVLYAETAEVRLNVTYAPEAPVVTLNVETGELECRADANPRANVSWERPDKITWECVAENDHGTRRSRVYRDRMSWLNSLTKTKAVTQATGVEKKRRVIRERILDTKPATFWFSFPTASHNTANHDEFVIRLGYRVLLARGWVERLTQKKPRLCRAPDLGINIVRIKTRSGK